MATAHHALLCLLFVVPSVSSQAGPVISMTGAGTKNLMDDVERLLNTLVRNAMPAMSDLMDKSNVSTACTASIFKAFLALRRHEPWVIRMLLSNGLLPANILEGSLVSVGSYSQCLKARVLDDHGHVKFKGQYCSLFIKPARLLLRTLADRFHMTSELTGRRALINGSTNEKVSNPNIRFGICAPSTCSANDLQFITTKMVSSYGITTEVNGCRTNDPKKMTKLQAGTVAFLCCLASVVVLATIVEYAIQRRNLPRKKHDPETPLRILLMFSAINNMRMLLRTTDVGRKKNPLNFVGGIKVFLMFWVVYGHAYIIGQMEFADDLFSLLEIFAKVPSQVLPNAVLSVSTFFFLSGFVLPFMVPKPKTSKTSLGTMYLVGIIKRYIRVTVPTMALILCFYLVPLMVDGPADQDNLALHERNCIERPWAVPALMNNFLPLHIMCLNHLWYVCADLQIFIVVGLPMALAILRYPKTSSVLSFAVALFCCGLTAYQIYKWGVTYSVTVGTADISLSLSHLEYIYVRPFCHVVSYVAGIFAGYLSVCHGSVPFGRWFQVAQWMLSLALLLFVMFVTVPWNEGKLPSAPVNALYGGFHRLLWSVALMWPCYASATGRGGWFDGFFSWTMLRPLSRLTFCIYLTHVPMFYIRTGNMRTNFELNEFFQLSTSMGIYWFSVVFGLALHLCVEAPVAHLQKFLFESDSEKSKASTDVKPSAIENGEQRSKL
ncbi:nose resistant to fluoxetine protein 6 isoform X1 [Rhipicephalus microplus]|uniref:nose resistant to fluoxetine protein 6 isoform X1 n=1 Tax=Rhipicephalus microplus TaxID=6941 RepID=UPI003F6C0275